MTPEIRAARLGKLTASVAAKVMGGLKTDGLESLVKRCAWERVHGDTEEEGFRSKAMDRGNEIETGLLDWYDFEMDIVVERQVHLTHPAIPFVGATPDALVRGVRTVQGKCPLHGAWMDVWRDREVPAEYRWQVRWEMWVAELCECHFVSWHPRAGGVIVPMTVTESECEQMAERAFLVNERIKEWVSILQQRQAA